MLAPKTRWMIQQPDLELAERLAEQCGIHPLVARLLSVRGYTTPEKVTEFLSAGQDELHDPFMLEGMTEAVSEIKSAISEGRLIRIYGDYDADGISSTSLLIRLMRELDAKHDYYIPHRAHEGYGLNRSALDKAKEDGVELIITVDTGISAVDEANYAAELGIKLIITDHHEPPEELPSALAVINPKKPSCPYPFKQLAGVGVAFKLAQALTDSVPDSLAELAALGTIADLMPLEGENRALVKLGLKQMQRTAYPGLRALFDIAGLEGKEITAGHIGFSIAPRVNASGRLTSADPAVQLLTTDHEQEAYMLAKELDELNRERQRIVDETVVEALQQLEQEHKDELPSVLIAAGDNWNAGVIGIAAARILERYYRPTLVFTIDPDTGLAKGSARSIAGYDIYRALSECSDLLQHFGGHKAAAGLTIETARLPELQERLNQLAAEWLSEDDYIPYTEVDLTCGIEDCTVDLIEQLEQLAPFGIGNRSPKFILQRLELREMRKIGKEGQHLKLQLADREDGQVLDAVGFGFGSLQPHISQEARIDLIGELQVNEWNGLRKPQLLIKDIRVEQLQVFDWRGLSMSATHAVSEQQCPGLRDEAEFVICEAPELWQDKIHAMFGDRPVRYLDESGRLHPAQSGQQGPPKDLVLVHLPRSKQALQELVRTYSDHLERICVWFVDAEDIASGSPDRERFKRLYGWLRQQEQWKPDSNLLRAWSSRTGLAPRDIAFILRVFEDLGFVKREGDRYHFVKSPEPRDLSESSFYERRISGQQLAEEILLLSTAQMTELLLEYASQTVELEVS